MKYASQPKNFSSLLLCTATLLLLTGYGCRQSNSTAIATNPVSDSLRVEELLHKGDSLYSRRSSMNAISESLLYFDSANRLAARIGNKELLANTLYYIGNVYNAWNGEPQKTIDYYGRSAAIFKSLPHQRIKEHYLYYIIAHAYDGEKAADSVRCVQAINAALQSIHCLPKTTVDSMDFLPDFAWVASNSKAYVLADSILAHLPFRPKNNPATNNYLDHYYLTRSQIAVYHNGNTNSRYPDSLAQALGNCNNRFDSAYYSLHLAELFDVSGQYKKALYYNRLSAAVNQQVSSGDVLTSLRTALLNGELRAEKEKQRLAEKDLENNNLYLVVVLLATMFTATAVGLYLTFLKRRQQRKEALLQESFTHQLLEKEEDERKRIATELHDGINHDLLALKNNLLLHKPVEADDVEEVITSVREVSRNLYPSLFESVGLPASLESLCQRLTAAGFFTTCDIAYIARLSKQDELQIYRIVQEALNNIMKHASAEACKITIRSNDAELRVEIKDNGVGFDAEKANASALSFGLQSMKQRARAVGADLRWESSANGTIVTLVKQH